MSYVFTIIIEINKNEKNIENYLQTGIIYDKIFTQSMNNSKVNRK